MADFNRKNSKFLPLLFAKAVSIDILRSGELVVDSIVPMKKAMRNPRNFEQFQIFNSNFVGIIRIAWRLENSRLWLIMPKFFYFTELS